MNNDDLFPRTPDDEADHNEAILLMHAVYDDYKDHVFVDLLVLDCIIKMFMRRKEKQQYLQTLIGERWKGVSERLKANPSYLDAFQTSYD